MSVDTTETRNIPELLSAPYKGSSEASGAVDVMWPDPKTIGGRRQIDAADVGRLPKDSLDF